MADIRIKDLTTTASSSASDDFIAVDGTTNGTRKLNAFSPTFGGNATVTGTLTTNGNVTINSNVGIIGKSGTGTGGNWRFVSDDGTSRWLTGLLGGSGETSYSIYDSANSRSLLTATAAGVVQINQTTASTTTSTGALVVGNGTSGGLGVGGNIYAGGNTFSLSKSGDNPAIKSTDGTIITKIQSVSVGDTAGYIGTESLNTLKIVTNNTAALTLTSSQQVQVNATTASTTTSSGALVVSGGVGVAGAIYAGGSLNISGVGGNTIAGNTTFSTGQIIVSNAYTPASASAAGTTGSITWDNAYIYVCVATNTWKRVAISTWA